MSKYDDFDGVMTTDAESEADNVGYYTFCQDRFQAEDEASEADWHSVSDHHYCPNC